MKFPICVDCRHMVPTKRGDKCSAPEVIVGEIRPDTGHLISGMTDCHTERTVVVHPYARMRCGWSGVHFKAKEQSVIEETTDDVE